MKLQKLSLLLSAAIAAIYAYGDAPMGYYHSCEGLSGKQLLQKLESVVGDHTVVGYNNLWSVYETSDVHPDGSLWDMYSTKNWGKNFTKCGNYSVVGDCVNKEHSMPKSWFSNASPMYSDAFHIYPTDGRVNGQRSNYPYGECAYGTYLASQGSVKPLGRLGASTFAGYTSTVFEPDDEYKGDFARTYFYMAAAYNSKIASWNSPMLAGNNYPCFSSWSVDLLLKWHRQDPVSEKETIRNDAVYAHQKNRNPFIDHPELAEYIWGNKQGQEWSESLDQEPLFISPIEGQVIKMPLGGTNSEITAGVKVVGLNLTEDVSVTWSGTGYYCSATTLPKDEVNGDGAMLYCSVGSPEPMTGMLPVKLKTGDVEVNINFACEIQSGIPVYPPSYVTAEGFTVNWVNNIIPAENDYFYLDVQKDDDSVEGYPLALDYQLETYRVEGLEPSTTYTFRVYTRFMESIIQTVSTADLIPSVTFYYDGDLNLFAEAGTPSEAAELLIDVDNIPGDVTLSVTAPFELSLNKQEWSGSVVIAPGADRFYLRVNSANAGSFKSSLVATAAGGFHDDDTEIEATIAPAGVSFLEDFEKEIPAGNGNGYGALTYEGNASTWATDQAYFEYNGANSNAHSGYQAVRFNKSGNRHITMLTDKPGGIGSVTLWGCPWGKDAADCTFNISISSDHGATWEKVGDITVPANGGQQNVYSEHSIEVNRPGALRLKLEQTGGARCMIDDVALTNFSDASVQLTESGHAYHSWDAYCLNHELVIENHDEANIFAVYALDGSLIHSGAMPQGGALQVAPGLYVVVVADFARRVLVN